jgi:putative DNA primase/helicase
MQTRNSAMTGRKDNSKDIEPEDIEEVEPRFPGVVLDIEAWPEPVDGVELLDWLVEIFETYLSLDEGAAEMLALWSVYTHAIDACQFAPRLFLKSPVPRCGKTTALGILGHVTRRPRPASNITPSTLFRVADEFQPTLLIDEADTFVAGRTRGELTGILNSGHTRQTAYVERTETVGKVKFVRRFSTFIPIAFAAIGGLPATIEDRSVIVPMRRKGSNEGLTRFREDRVDGLKHLARMAARWVVDNFHVLREGDPEMPEYLNDRAQDNYRMLVTIADTAGGDWPQRARDAIAALTGGDGEASPAEILLGDIRDIFDARREDRIASAMLVDHLIQLEHRPWGSLNQHTLAQMLAPFGIAPRVFRIGRKTHRGYERAWFADAFVRYAPVTSATIVTPPTNPDGEHPETKQRLSEAAPRAPVDDTRQRQHGGPTKRETLRFDHAYLKDVDEPDDGSSFWEVRVETGDIDRRVKGFAKRAEAEAYLQRLRAAGEVTL